MQEGFHILLFGWVPSSVTVQSFEKGSLAYNLLRF